MSPPPVNPPADSADPVSNAVISPKASLFVRKILLAALGNPVNMANEEIAEAHALVANVMMNDVLNSWDPTVNIQEAQDHVDEAMKANPPGPVLALAFHAQGLIYRKQGNHKAALDDFNQAVVNDGGFARAQAQRANEMIIFGEDRNQARQQLETLLTTHGHHPARGYFHWAIGRSYFMDQDWDNAINWLNQSINELPTVSYNQLYLAAAQQLDTKNPDAIATLQRFIDDPQFGAPELGKEKVQALIPPEALNPHNDPLIAARQNLRVGLSAALAQMD